MLPVISLLMVLTPISARQLLWGKATELRRWCTPQSERNCLVASAINSGPPSDDNSSEMPYVAKVCRRMSMSPHALSFALSHEAKSESATRLSEKGEEEEEEGVTSQLFKIF